VNADSVGMYVRGQLEMRRQNFELALAAFSKAGSYPGAERQIANALDSLGSVPEEVSAALLTAYQNGDLRALPWLVFESAHNHVQLVEFKALKKKLEKFINQDNPEILGAQARLLILKSDFKKGIALLERAVKLNDPAGKTFLAYICMSQEIEEDLSRRLKKMGAKSIYRSSEDGEFDEEGIEYVRGLLDQGEFQNFFGANLALLQLELTTQSRGWISEHARVLTSNPSDFPSQWNDPEYLAELSFAWLRSNSNAELTQLVLRMKDFSLDDIFLELIEEVRIEAENETLFDDLFEDSETVPLISATVQREISPIQDAREMFGAELAIDDFLSILEAGDFNEYVEKSDLLVLSAFQGNEKDYLRASQLIQFVFEKGANFGSYNRYSFYLQSDSLIKAFENQSISSAFIQDLVPRLLTSRPSNGGAKKMLSPETYEGLIQAIYFKKGVASDISKDIEKAFPTVLEFWDIARRIIFYADEVTNGNFTHLKQFQEVIRRYYPHYQDVESAYFTEDWLWNVSVHETIDIALENHNAIESNDFREFVLSLVELDPHFGCKLIYADLWGPSGGYQALSRNESQELFVSSKQLTEIIKFGACDEDSGRDDSCLSNFTLAALHPNSAPETLELILGMDHYESAPKWAVARNKNASEKTLMSLAQSSENSWRVIGLIEDEMLNLKSLSNFPAEVQSYVAFAVAVNPSSSNEVLAQIQAIDPSSQAWTDVQLRNTQTSESLPADEVVAQINTVAKR
jgi:hypothetical protein